MVACITVAVWKEILSGLFLSWFQAGKIKE